MTTDRTLQSIADVLAANEQHMVPRDPNQPEPHWRDITGLPEPRPVSSPEDRMADARTGTDHLDVAAELVDAGLPHDVATWLAARDARTAPTFRTYLDATERDQLDARAVTAEQERDDALQDRDEARQTAKDLYGTLKTIERERNEAIDARDVLRTRLNDVLALASFRKGVIDRYRQEVDHANAVVEAAKLWRRWHGNTNAAYADACQALTAAVDALSQPQSPPLGSLPPCAQEGDAWAALDEAMGPVLAQAVGESVDAAEIERYADQLRNDAAKAEDAVAVGLLRAADGLTDLLAEPAP